MLTERTAAAYEVFFTRALLYLALCTLIAVLFRLLGGVSLSRPDPMMPTSPSAICGTSASVR